MRCLDSDKPCTPGTGSFLPASRERSLTWRVEKGLGAGLEAQREGREKGRGLRRYGSGHPVAA